VSTIDEWVPSPTPPPPTDRFGLRFSDPATETEYDSWRAEHVFPITKFALYAACIAASIALVGGALALTELQLLSMALIIAVAAIQIGGAVDAARFGASQRLLWWPWAANFVGGFLAILATAPREDAPVTAFCVSLVVIFGLMVFRMRPIRAHLAVVPYTTSAIALLIWWAATDAVSVEAMILGVSLLALAVVSGSFVNLTTEWVARRAFVAHLTIEQQREALFEERTNMARFLSPEVAEAIHTHGLSATVRTEMLSLTAVCVDLRGFTAYTHLHGAVTMAEVLREFYAAVVTAAATHGATVNGFAGDGAMVLVGAPLQRADHTRAGLRLARDLMSGVREITERHSHDTSTLGVGVGIASGECAVGPIGSLTQLEYTAVGSSVNLASRLCDVALDGQIVMAPGTARALEESPGWQRMVLDLPGFPEPVEVTIEATAAAARSEPVALALVSDSDVAPVAEDPDEDRRGSG
jgi:class 3 adenylate cyclase